MKTTDSGAYAERLVSLQEKKWKTAIRRFDPYGMHIKKVCTDTTLEVGCGIGRLMQFIPNHIVGVDHNADSIAFCKSKNLSAYTVDEFKKTQAHLKGTFKFLLMSHLLEHLTQSDCVALIKSYREWLAPDATIVVICPQEVGYASDETHVNFMDFNRIKDVLTELNYEVESQYSFPFPFPFPRFMGRFFIYNEFVVIARPK